ncbi:PH domain-containing protein [Erythrobacter sp. JK5]|nr:PH domain-containing protein [Erythrobacter sp. JK5]
MGTPAADEKVLWKGQPNLPILARTAFHTRTIAIYFLALVAISAAAGNLGAAVVCTVLGLSAIAVLHLLAWRSARTTLYILTDARLIMRIGMALETRINIPLKHIGAAHLNDRGTGHGDIALELNGDRMLGHVLLWPHVRPFKFAMPQPMLRAVPDAQTVAAMLADACAGHQAIERNLTEIKDAPGKAATQARGAVPSARPGTHEGIPDNGLEGVPA